MRAVMVKAGKLGKVLGTALILATMVSGSALASPEQLSDQQMAWITAGSVSVLLGFADGRIHVSLDGTTLKITGTTTHVHSLSVIVDGKHVHLSGKNFNYTATVSSSTGSVVVTSGTQSPVVSGNSGAVVIHTDTAATISSVSQGATGSHTSVVSSGKVTTSNSGKTVTSIVGQSNGSATQSSLAGVNSMLKNLGISVTVGR